MIKYIITTILCALTPIASFAGGMCLYEISTAEMRLGTAGWASRAEDPSTVFTNPAGMTRFRGPTVQAGVEAIYAHIPFDPNAATNVEGTNGNASAWLPAGSSFYVQPILDDCLAVGIGALGYFGSNLNCGKEWVGRYHFTKVFLEGFSLVPAAAYKITDCLSVGVGANVMYGIFDQHSAVKNLFSNLPDGKMLLRHRYLTAGAVVGVLYEFTPCTRIGVQYLSPVSLRFHMVPNFKGLGPVLEEALRLTGILKSKINLKVNVPQSVMVSVYHDIGCLSLMADAGWQQWSRFQRATLVLNDPDSTALTFVPKYQDTWHVALGGEFRLNSSLTLSAGAAYDSSCVTDKNRPLDFPVGKQWRFGTGGRWFFSDCLYLDLCYEFLWSGNLKVDASGGRLSGNVDGKWRDFYSHFLSADLIFNF